MAERSLDAWVKGTLSSLDWWAWKCADEREYKLDIGAPHEDGVNHTPVTLEPLHFVLAEDPLDDRWLEETGLYDEAVGPCRARPLGRELVPVEVDTPMEKNRKSRAARYQRTRDQSRRPSA